MQINAIIQISKTVTEGGVEINLLQLKNVESNNIGYDNAGSIFAVLEGVILGECGR
jgi:hypothetical protein